MEASDQKLVPGQERPRGRCCSHRFPFNPTALGKKREKIGPCKRKGPSSAVPVTTPRPRQLARRSVPSIRPADPITTGLPGVPTRLHANWSPHPWRAEMTIHGSRRLRCPVAAESPRTIGCVPPSDGTMPQYSARLRPSTQATRTGRAPEPKAICPRAEPRAPWSSRASGTHPLSFWQQLMTRSARRNGPRNTKESD